MNIKEKTLAQLLKMMAKCYDKIDSYEYGCPQDVYEKQMSKITEICNEIDNRYGAISMGDLLKIAATENA